MPNLSFVCFDFKVADKNEKIVVFFLKLTSIEYELEDALFEINVVFNQKTCPLLVFNFLGVHVDFKVWKHLLNGLDNAKK